MLEKLFLAMGLVLAFEGALYALFPTFLRSMLRQIDKVSDADPTQWWPYCFGRRCRFGLDAWIGFLKYATNALSQISFCYFAHGIARLALLLRGCGADGFADLAERLMPAVVNISTSQTVSSAARVAPVSRHLNDFFEEFFNQRRGGPVKRRAAKCRRWAVVSLSTRMVSSSLIIM